MIRKKIKEAIANNGLSYSQVAEAIGVRKATISDYLNGHSEMKSNSLERLFTLLRIVLEIKH